MRDQISFSAGPPLSSCPFSEGSHARTLLILLIVWLASGLLIEPAPVAAQPPPAGCPWCTTPTRCELIQENTHQLWVADITCIATSSSMLYLAVVLDVWSRRVVGWAMATHLRSELVVSALNMAPLRARISRRFPRRTSRAAPDAE